MIYWDLNYNINIEGSISRTFDRAIYARAQTDLSYRPKIIYILKIKIKHKVFKTQIIIIIIIIFQTVTMFVRHKKIRTCGCSKILILGFNESL